VIIEIDSYFGSVLLVCDRTLKYTDLVKLYQEIKISCSNNEELTTMLKERLQLSEIPEIAECRVDFVIDTDTDRIYKPIY